MMYTLGNGNNDEHTGIRSTLPAAWGMRGIWPFTLPYAFNGEERMNLGIGDARKLMEELTADVAALKGKIMLMKSRLNEEPALQDVPAAEEAPVEIAAPSKALGMVHHLKHTKNSIRQA